MAPHWPPLGGAATAARLARALEGTPWLARVVLLAMRARHPDAWGFDGFLELVCAPEGYAARPVRRVHVPPDVVYDADAVAAAGSFPVLVRAAAPPHGALDPPPEPPAIVALRLPLQCNR